MINCTKAGCSVFFLEIKYFYAISIMLFNFATIRAEIFAPFKKFVKVLIKRATVLKHEIKTDLKPIKKFNSFLPNF